MKTAILLLLLFLISSAQAQSVIGSVNAGAVSSNSMSYSVGEVFVVPLSNPNNTNSGLMGILSYLSFFVVGLDESLSSDDFRVFPNPTTHSVSFEVPVDKPFRHVYISDIHGKRVADHAEAPKSIDLSGLPGGTYFIQTDNNDIPPLKIIKQNP